ncbi:MULTISPECIES: class A beta-lactamase [unclassified Herbaspirillum]|uniref:class A beta-lactamase n=1 Tax=unclassified Herbaspirillum TaxID=2624150 RepID=UPI001152A195|nr:MULTISPECIES: class A beta-lactamase [unclassified Herbaspirillum]MBB5391849.1 beta-lactamase class A [Herbaspirillum sp. SJZ102]TQK13308.1 beta-lactamase class A [Herbaspirillum sp. SJZ130]TQK15312.1 beta-lactamase class A [Herbaspirillum sp. SJZ106]
MLDRRNFLTLAGLAASGWLTDALAAQGSNTSKPDGSGSFVQQMAKLESGVNGRLGVFILDTAKGRQWGYRADERFPMCSTFKFLASAAVLKRIDQGEERLERRIVYTKESLVPYSPTTGKHTGGNGLSMSQLCEAAMTLSDNTAANLMLESLGGPAGLTAFIRSLGDDLTRLDRNEPTLNESLPGDPRDTTTPAAMVADLRKIVLGNALNPASRTLITQWLLDNQTGAKRVRAGLPTGWKVGDKTGTGSHGSTNTVGVAWTPQGVPLLFAVYLTETGADEAQRNGLHAAIGKLIAAKLA